MPKELSVMLAPSKQADLDNLSYPLMASLKVDGIRCIVKEDQLLLRSGKPVPNPLVHDLLAPLMEHDDWWFDGELWSPSIPFGELNGIIRSKSKLLPDDLALHVFDGSHIDDWYEPEVGAICRWDYTQRLLLGQPCIYNPPQPVKIIEQVIVNNREEVEAFIKKSGDLGFEGIMLRDPDSLYKHGRATFKSQSLLKHKFWEDYDCKILSVHEGVKNKEGIERERDELGRSKVVHSKDLKEPSGLFGYFVVQVDMPGRPTMHIGGWKGLTHGLRKEILENAEDYIGRWGRFQGMAVGVKDLPRIPKNFEFRDDKEFQHE